MFKTFNTIFSIIVLCFVIFDGLAVAYQFKFTNLKCFSYNESALQFPNCRLRVKQRNLISLSVETIFTELPIQRFALRLESYRKALSYQPFLYNATIDLCKLGVSPIRFPLVRMFTDVLSDHVKFNGCPINNSLGVRDLTIDTNQFGYFPVPPGEYMTKSTLIIGGRASGYVSVYYSMVE